MDGPADPAMPPRDPFAFVVGQTPANDTPAQEPISVPLIVVLAVIGGVAIILVLAAVRIMHAIAHELSN